LLTRPFQRTRAASQALAGDSTGKINVADTGNALIRQIAPDVTVSTPALIAVLAMLVSFRILQFRYGSLVGPRSFSTSLTPMSLSTQTRGADSRIAEFLT